MDVVFAMSRTVPKGILSPLLLDLFLVNGESGLEVVRQRSRIETDSRQQAASWRGQPPDRPSAAPRPAAGGRTFAGRWFSPSPSPLHDLRIPAALDAVLDRLVRRALLGVARHHPVNLLP